jgi:ribosomal subunit interface protein
MGDSGRRTTMQVQITARHFHASPQLHDNLKEAIDRLEKFNGTLTGAHVILDGQNVGVRRAEIVVKIAEKQVHAHAEEDNMHKAIDSMLEKLERQLKKENEKMKAHKGEPLHIVAD